jgi:acyl-CoA-binding protein
MDVAELSMFLDTLGMGKSDALGKDFEDAANSVKNMKNLDDAQKLQLYGLYKQSTVGDVQISRPSQLDFAGAAKWYVRTVLGSNVSATWD